MIYYQHKQTGEVIGSLNNLRDLITENGYDCITEVVMPNKQLGNGIISHCMTFTYISKNYKRISRKKAMQLCPDFGQWRHIDNQYNTSAIYGQYSMRELIPMKEQGYGIPFSDYAKKKREQHQTIFN